MASKRMINVSLINSDDFQSLSASAQALYFQFISNGDDDGFIGNPKGLMRMGGKTDNDLKELVDNGFVISFGKVIVVTHWNVHNQIRKDRRQPTLFVEEHNDLVLDESNVYHLKKINDTYDSSCTDQDEIQCATCTPQEHEQVSDIEHTVRGIDAADTLHRLDNVSLDKNSLAQERSGERKNADNSGSADVDSANYKKIEQAWNTAAEKNGMKRVKESSVWTSSRKKRLKTLVKRHGMDDVLSTIEKAGDSSFLGGGGDRGWRCTFDWFVKAQNYEKISEGNYSNHEIKMNSRFSGDNDVSAYL